MIIFVYVGAPVLKCFKFVERKSQREMLRVIFDNATLTTSVFSGTVSKLRLTVSSTSQQPWLYNSADTLCIFVQCPLNVYEV